MTAPLPPTPPTPLSPTLALGKYTPRHLLWLTLLTALYYLAGRLGLSLALINPSASAIWPPTGIAIAALLLGGRRYWPAIFIGAFLVNLTTSGSVSLALMIAAGNTAEAVVAVVLLQHLAHGEQVFDTALGMLQFLLFGALLPGIISAAVGTGGLVLFGFAPVRELPQIWSTWWLGDATGALLCAPPMVMAARWWHEPATRWPRKHYFDTALIFLGFLVAGFAAFTRYSPVGMWDYPLFLMIVPLVLWSAFRLPNIETAMGILMLACFAVIGTRLGLGPFARYEPNTGLLLLQVFMGLTTLIGLVVAAEVSDRRRAVATLAHREQMYSVVVESATDGIISVDESDHITFANAAAAKLFGYRRQELQGMELTALMPPGLRAGHTAGFERYLATGQRTMSWQNRELLGRHKSGREVPLEVSYGEHSNHQRLFTGILRDITQRQQAEAAERWLATIVADSNDAIFSKDLNGKVLTWNHGAELLFGYTAEEMVGQSVIRLYPAEKVPEHMDILERLRRGERIDHIETERLRKNGSTVVISVTLSPIIDAAGRVIAASSVSRDITERRQAEEQVRHQAHHDALTGLPNRLKFREHLLAGLELAAREKKRLALLFIDLDRFKQINDSLGHDCGDLLLQTVAHRLEHSIRHGDIVARLGGDEFVILLVDGITPEIAQTIGLNLLAAVRAPMQLRDQPVAIGASVGIAVFPDHGRDESTLMIAADRAMYGAKNGGRNRCQCAGSGLPTLPPDSATPEQKNRRANTSSRRITRPVLRDSGAVKTPEVPFE